MYKSWQSIHISLKKKIFHLFLLQFCYHLLTIVYKFTLRWLVNAADETAAQIAEKDGEEVEEGRKRH